MKKGLGKHLHDIIKLSGEISYFELEEICRDIDGRRYKTDTGRRALDKFKDIKAVKAEGKNYISKWVYIGEDILEETRRAFKEAKEGQGSLKL